MGYKFNPTTGGLDVVSDPGGSDTQIQFNDAGSFGGDVDLTWNKTTNVMTLKGDLTLDDNVAGSVTTLQTITPTQNNTISLPNATGTLALVAGSSGQLLYNNAGANAGVSTFTADSSGRLTNSASSASGFPVKLWNGTIFAGATPHVLVQPTGASTPTSTNAWSANGTALAVNTAAGFTGNLLDMQINGSRVFRVSQNDFTFTNISSNQSLSFDGSYLRLSRNTSITPSVTISATTDYSLRLASPSTFGWTASNSDAALDLALVRDAANTLAQRNGTSAQTFRVYGTESSSLANYVRASLSSSSTAVTLAAETAGTGADDIPLNLTAAGTGTVKVNSNLEIADAKDVVLGTTTGTKIGTATTQKLGFYNKTPVVQPTAVADATDAASVITQLNALLSRMRDLGLIAT